MPRFPANLQPGFAFDQARLRIASCGERACAESAAFSLSMAFILFNNLIGVNDMLPIQAEEYNNEKFICERCHNRFEAKIVTWVDVSGAPRVRALLQEGEFNMITCPRCGLRQFSGSPFFYEDFADGLLLAVFPVIPANHVSMQEEIKQQYAYYPLLEFFYDMTQLWLLIYFQDHYGNNNNVRTSSRAGIGEKRLKRILRFLKTDPLMVTLRKTLTETLSGDRPNDDLQDVLWRALATIDAAVPAVPDSAAIAVSKAV